MAEVKEEELELTLDEDSTQNDSDKNNDDASAEESVKIENEASQKDEKPTFKKKTENNKIKLILFGVIGFLLVTLVIGLILYLIGFFDPEEPKKEPISPKKVQTKNIEPKNEYKFSLKNVNTDNLNKELSKLTNKNILEKKALDKIDEQKQILEKEKKEYKEKLALQEEQLTKEKQLLQAKKEQLENQKNELEILKEQAKSLKEEMLREKEILEVKREKLILAQMEIENTIKHEENKKEQEKSEKDVINNVQVDTKPMNNEKTSPSGFVNLINVAKIKGELYKDYLDKILMIHNDVLLCRDDFNNIEIYFGPFFDNNKRNEIYNKLIEENFSNAYEVELTKEEFDKRCNY